MTRILRATLYVLCLCYIWILTSIMNALKSIVSSNLYLDLCVSLLVKLASLLVFKISLEVLGQAQKWEAEICGEI